MTLAQVVLIGPVCTGKSTLLPLVAGQLGVAGVDLDEIAGPYYEEAGASVADLVDRAGEVGFLEAHRWWQYTHPHAVRRVLRDYPNAAVALGAGHTHHEDVDRMSEIAVLLEPCFTVFVLPSSDLDRSIDVLRERAMRSRDTDWRYGGYDFLEHWVKDQCNHSLAKFMAYTDRETPAETAARIAKAATADAPA